MELLGKKKDLLQPRSASAYVSSLILRFILLQTQTLYFSVIRDICEAPFQLRYLSSECTPQHTYMSVHKYMHIPVHIYKYVHMHAHCHCTHAHT